MFRYWPILGHSSIWNLKYTFSLFFFKISSPEDQDYTTTTNKCSFILVKTEIYFYNTTDKNINEKYTNLLINKILIK